MEEFLTTLFDRTNPVYQVIVAAFLGIFIGLRSEADVIGGLKARARTVRKRALNITGIRTMTLLVVLGTVSTFIEVIAFLPLILFVAILIFVLIAYSNGVFKLQRYGLTAEITLVLAYLIGVLIGSEQLFVAILLSVFVGISTAYKQQLRSFAGNLSLKEWSGALQLLVISALILPLLPQTAIDPFGVFVPFDIWVLVIILAALGFVGYFFSKYLDEKKSIVVTSFLGSLVSSTATTTALAARARERQADTTMLVAGIMIAICVMQLRVLVEILLLSNGVHVAFLAPAAAMCVAAALCAVYYHVQSRSKKARPLKKVTNRSPFELMPALSFAFFFTIVLFGIYFAQQFFGDIGAYITTFIAAFADVDVIIFSTLLSFQKSLVTIDFVANVIAIAVIVNTAVKLFYVYTFGTRTFFMKSLVPLSFISVVGIMAAYFF